MHGWSTSLTVASRDRAVVGGEWCELSQCEGACYCVLHGNTVPPATLRNTGEEVASDHSIASAGNRRGPKKCHVPYSGSDTEVLRWTSRD